MSFDIRCGAGTGNQWRIRSLPQWSCMTGLAVVAGRSTTLKAQSHQRRLDRGELGEVSTQVDRARHPAKAVAYLSVDLVDQSPEARNSRQRYDEASINELATSIQEHGVLQPILVSPSPMLARPRY